MEELQHSHVKIHKIKPKPAKLQTVQTSKTETTIDNKKKMKITTNIEGLSFIHLYKFIIYINI